MFAGSDGGAENWATVGPLIENCKNDMDPLAYLTDVLTRIVNVTLMISISCCRGPTESKT